MRYRWAKHASEPPGGIILTARRHSVPEPTLFVAIA